MPVIEIDGEKIKRCPFKLVTNQSVQYIHFWNHFKEGFLPNEGPILLQPDKFIQAVRELNVISSEEDK